MRTVTIALAALLALSSTASAGHFVSTNTFRADQARQDRAVAVDQHRQDRKIHHNARVNRVQDYRINRNASGVRRNARTDMVQDRQLSVLDSEVQDLWTADEKARERDAAILSLDKPMMSSTDNYGVEMGIARAGGSTGVGISGVARIGSSVYGTAGLGVSGGSAVGRVGLGLAF